MNPFLCFSASQVDDFFNAKIAEVFAVMRHRRHSLSVISSRIFPHCREQMVNQWFVIGIYDIALADSSFSVLFARLTSFALLVSALWVDRATIVAMIEFVLHHAMTTIGNGCLRVALTLEMPSEQSRPTRFLLSEVKRKHFRWPWTRLEVNSANLIEPEASQDTLDTDTRQSWRI